MTPEQEHRQAQCRALNHPGGNAHRLFSTSADRAPRDQPGLSRAHQPFSPADRQSGGDQHQLQRAERADRVHAGGRLPLLHGHRARPARRRQRRPAKGGPGSRPPRPLQGQIRVGLRLGEIGGNCLLVTPRAVWVHTNGIDEQIFGAK